MSANPDVTIMCARRRVITGKMGTDVVLAQIFTQVAYARLCDLSENQHARSLKCVVCLLKREL